MRNHIVVQQFVASMTGHCWQLLYILAARVDAMLTMSKPKRSTAKRQHFVSTLLTILCLSFASMAQAQPALTISKSASSSILTVDSQLVYTLTIANTGDTTATNVVVEDDLSSRVIFESATGGGSIGAQDPQGAVVTWNFASIAPGQSGSVSITTTVQATVLQSWENSATIVSDQTASVTSNEITVIVLDDPELTLQKSVSRADVNAGDTLVYTLEYSNIGPTPANNLVITDTIDPNLTFVSADNNGIPAGNVITWTGSSLAPGQTGSVTFTATVNAAADGTVISNSASIDSDETTPVSSNTVNTTLHSETAIQVLATASPGKIQPGEVLQFTTKVKNSTGNPAEDVVITARIPSDTTYVSNLGGGVFNVDTVTWDIGTIGPLQTQSVVMSVRLDDDLANGDQINYNSNVTLSNGSTAGAGLIIFVSSEPLLSLQKTPSSTTISADEELTYTLDFANQGSETPGAVLRDFLPYQTTFVSATSGGSHANGIVTWDLGALPANTSGSVAVTVVTGSPLLNGTLLSNVAELEPLLGLGVSASADVTVSTLPNLTLSKSTSQSVVSAGENLSYTLQYQNTGATTANNVVIADVLPQGTSFLPPSSGGSESGGVVTWNVGNVGPGQGGSISLTVLVDGVVPNGTLLHNSASIRADNSPPSQSPLVDTIVDSRPDLQFSKQASPAQAAPGGNVTYTLAYENTGSDAATNIVITDLLPDMTNFISASNGGDFDDMAGTITWNIGSVPALASGSVNLVVALQDDVANGAVIANTAGIESAETGLTIADATVTATVAVITAPVQVPALPLVALASLIGIIGWAGLQRHKN